MVGLMGMWEFVGWWVEKIKFQFLKTLKKN